MSEGHYPLYGTDGKPETNWANVESFSYINEPSNESDYLQAEGNEDYGPEPHSITLCDSYIHRIRETNESALDIDIFLGLCLGDKRHPYQYLIPLTIVNCLMFITGTIGNVLVCYIIIKNPSMRTSTNFFLFSLAVSDLTVLFVGLPNDLHVYWQQYPWIFGEPLCKIRALVSEMTSYSSVLTIVAFSMERYLAICHPLYSYTMSGLRRASKIIAGLWLFAFAAAFPYAVYTKVHYITHPFTNQH